MFSSFSKSFRIGRRKEAFSFGTINKNGAQQKIMENTRERTKDTQQKDKQARKHFLSLFEIGHGEEDRKQTINVYVIIRKAVSTFLIKKTFFSAQSSRNERNE